MNSFNGGFMKPVLIQGGRVVDPGRMDDIADILIDKGNIVRVAYCC